MPRESKFVQIARARNKSVSDMLIDQLNESGTIERAAVALGIGYHHVVRKVKQLEIEKYSVYRRREDT